jgi:NTE family protein
MKSLAALLIAALVLSACSLMSRPAAQQPQAVAKAAPPKPRIALALGGGAARGFAHVA